MHRLMFIYERPLKLENKTTYMDESYDVGIEYLEKLRTVIGQPILQHRRKTFVLGINTALSVISPPPSIQYFFDLQTFSRSFVTPVYLHWWKE